MSMCDFMHYVMLGIKFADDHQGTCMVLLTIALALCAIISCVLAFKNIKIMKESEIERARPIVVLEAIADLPFYLVRMKNTGLTAARNVIVDLSPSVVYCFGSWKERPIGFMSRNIDFLPPNYVLQTNLGVFSELEAYNPSLMHKGFIRYEDASGRRYEESIVLDFSIFKDTVFSGKKTINDLGVELEKIRRAMDGFGSGFNKLRVIAQSLDDYREEDRRAMEEARRRINAEKSKAGANPETAQKKENSSNGGAEGSESIDAVD